MKTIKLFAIVVCICVAVFIAKAFWQTNNSQSFAVIELFTSEGCSSCPPADALVAKIETEMAGKPVYILAYHVDYWDRLGWKDAFSHVNFSNRQKQYSKWLKLESVYTPQIVVNGQKEFVGSQENTLRSAITTSLQNVGSTKLVLNNLTFGKAKASVEYKAENVAATTSLLVAVVQKKGVTNVKSGENGGRTLSHVQIVRTFETIFLNGKNTGNISIDLPMNINSHELEIIAFLQNNADGKISAATKATVN